MAASGAQASEHTHGAMFAVTGVALKPHVVSNETAQRAGKLLLVGEIFHQQKNGVTEKMAIA